MYLGSTRHLCTGWRRYLGCPDWQVSFRQRATDYGALLQKLLIFVYIILQIYMCIQISVLEYKHMFFVGINQAFVYRVAKSQRQ